MTNSKSTKRALFTSALAMLMCVAMLIGTTFAWFTDTASTAVNKIQSGTLDVELYYADNTTGGEGTTWTKITNETPAFNFVKAAAAPANEAVLWEPGCTYSLPALKIKNEGNLALKYKVLFSATDTDAENLELAKVLDVTMNGQSAGTLYDVLTSTDADGYAHGTLEGNKETDAITLSVKMRETAGNEYQDLSIGGIAITVYATQDTVEYDSNGNQYDADAKYTEVVAEGKTFTGTATLTTGITATNPHAAAVNVTGAAANVTIEDGTFDGGSNGNNRCVQVSNNATVTIKGGTFTVGGDASGDGNSVIYSDGGNVVIEGGFFYTDYAWNGFYYVLNQNNSNPGTITVKGGTFVNYNPANGDDNLHGNFVAEGCKVVVENQANGDVWYTVVAE